MKLYQDPKAPNPRRARLFMAEKGVDFDAIQIVNIDIAAGENLDAVFKRKNPIGGVPVLELDDGTCISESVAISRYYEAAHPEPPLMGITATEQAIIEMWSRRMDLHLLLPVAMAFRHSTGYFKDRETICPDYGEASLAYARTMFDFMNDHLVNSEYIAGESFSIADITALCAIDFARVIKLRIDADQPHLKAGTTAYRLDRVHSPRARLGPGTK